MKSRDTVDKPLRLHLGCGHHELDGFTHIDMSSYAHVDFHYNVRDIPFGDGSVDLIYASHVLEYFDEIEVPCVLREWHRLLAPGGELRVAVPDFDALVDVYQESHSLALILGPLYGRMRAGNQIIYHKSTWDFQSLGIILRSVGFRGIQIRDDPWYPELDDCSCARTDTGGSVINISLNIQAVKSG